MAFSPNNRHLLIFSVAAFFLLSVYLTTNRLSIASTILRGEQVPLSSSSQKSLGGGSAQPDHYMASGKHGKTPKVGPVLLGAIPEDLVPTEANGRRLIVVGDIHGMDAELAALLKKADFSQKTDHLVATGDVVSKGPDSSGVVSRLMDLNATTVRGNHEDKVLQAWSKARSKTAAASGDDKEEEEDAGSDASEKRGDKKHLAVARSLSDEQLDWLSQRPVILTAEPLPIYIVHAGLVPGLELRKQDPWAVMNMRTVLRPGDELRKKQGGDEPGAGDAEEDAVAVPVEGREGRPWAKAWNKYQHRLKERERRTVLYGHDAKTGFIQGDYTFGLDSGCVRGGALTALVITADGKGFKYKKVEVACGKH